MPSNIMRIQRSLMGLRQKQDAIFEGNFCPELGSIGPPQARQRQSGAGTTYLEVQLRCTPYTLPTRSSELFQRSMKPLKHWKLPAKHWKLLLLHDSPSATEKLSTQSLHACRRLRCCSVISAPLARPPASCIIRGSISNLLASLLERSTQNRRSHKHCTPGALTWWRRIR